MKMITHALQTLLHPDKESRQSYGLLLGLAGCLCNMGLFVCKLVLGMATNSMAVLSDAFNNLTDAASSLAVWAGFQAASLPADARHPFGHGRMEYISGIIVAALILLTGIGIARSGLERLVYPKTVEIGLAGLAGLILFVLAKLGMAVFYRRANRRLASPTVGAAALDSLTDAAATLLTLAACLFGSMTSLPLDGIVSLLLALVILVAGGKALLESLSRLVGESSDPDLEREIVEELRALPEVLEVHALRIHEYGPTVLLGSVVLELSPSLSFNEAHNVAVGASRAVRSRFGLELTVHVEPAEEEGRLFNAAFETSR